MGRQMPKAILGEQGAWLLERTKAKHFALRGLVAGASSAAASRSIVGGLDIVHDDILSFKRTVVAGKRDHPGSRTARTTRAFSSESLPWTLDPEWIPFA